MRAPNALSCNALLAGVRHSVKAAYRGLNRFRQFDLLIIVTDGVWISHRIGGLDGNMPCFLDPCHNIGPSGAFVCLGPNYKPQIWCVWAV